MDTPGATRPARVLAVLDDTAGSEDLIEWSSALAHALQRPLSLVYVESTSALAAATLPFTQVLAHAGAEWSAFGAEEVERGYRVHAARLRTLAERITLRLSVHWSLRTVRGVLPHAALEMLTETDLLFVGAAAPAALRAPVIVPGRPPCPPMVAVLADESASDARCLSVARQLVQALNARLQVVRLPPGAGPEEQRRLLACVRADMLVLPAPRASAVSLAGVLRPVLMVT